MSLKVACLVSSGSEPTAFPVIVTVYSPARIFSATYYADVAEKVALPSVSPPSKTPSKFRAVQGISGIPGVVFIMLVHSYSIGQNEGSILNGFNSNSRACPVNLSLGKSV